MFKMLSFPIELPKLTIFKCKSANFLCKIYCRERFFEIQICIKATDVKFQVEWEKLKPPQDFTPQQIVIIYLDSQAIKSLKGTVQTMALSLKKIYHSILCQIFTAVTWFKIHNPSPRGAHPKQKSNLSIHYKMIHPQTIS